MRSSKVRAMIRVWIGVLFSVSPLYGAPNDLDLALLRLRQVGFQCHQETPNPIHRCLGRVPGYSKKVAFFIPFHFKSQKDSMGIITHFHGHTVSGDDFKGTLARYHLGGELARSGADRILVIPESVGKCETYAAELGTWKHLQEFHNTLLVIFKTSGLVSESISSNAITHEISGHSGAYRAMGRILGEFVKEGRTVRVGLFDATYCSNPETPSCRGIRDFSKKFPGWLKSYYLQDSPTARGSELIVPDADRIPVNPKTRNHFSIMDGYYSEWILMVAPSGVEPEHP